MSAQMFAIVRQVGEERGVINVSAVIQEPEPYGYGSLHLLHHLPPSQISVNTQRLLTASLPKYKAPDRHQNLNLKNTEILKNILCKQADVFKHSSFVQPTAQ